jgi:RsiW-degrading membrane proteinase PrsW (M82 family)
MPDPAASAAVVFVNLIATAGWFLLLLALDPNRRAKKTARALLECYLLGLGSVALALLLHWVVDLPLLAGSRVGNAVYEELRTGLVEEAAKFLVFYAITRTMRSLKEPLDGVLQAAAVALAFASVENLLYGVRFASVGLVLKRTLITTTGHLSYAAIWGLFTACLRFGFLKGEARAGRRVLALAVLGAALLHSTYNLLLDVGQWPFALALDAFSLLVAFRFLRSLARQPLYGAQPIAQPEQTLRLLHGSWQQGGDIPWAWPTCPAAIPPRRCAIWAAAGP